MDPIEDSLTHPVASQSVQPQQNVSNFVFAYFCDTYSCNLFCSHVGTVAERHMKHVLVVAWHAIVVRSVNIKIGKTTIRRAQKKRCVLCVLLHLARRHLVFSHKSVREKQLNLKSDTSRKCVKLENNWFFSTKSYMESSHFCEWAAIVQISIKRYSYLQGRGTYLVHSRKSCKTRHPLWFNRRLFPI